MLDTRLDAPRKTHYRLEPKSRPVLVYQGLEWTTAARGDFGSDPLLSRQLAYTGPRPAWYHTIWVHRAHSHDGCPSRSSRRTIAKANFLG